MKFLYFIVVCVAMSLTLSCNGNKKSGLHPDLMESVRKIQQKLPVKIEEGNIATKLEYTDTLLTYYYEIDENIIPFDDLVRAKHYQKYHFLNMIFESKDLVRVGLEQCVLYNVGIKYILTGKHSHKEMSFVVSPLEIKQALDGKSNPNEALRRYVDMERNSMPEELAKGISITNVDLKDGKVCYTVTIDENIYDFSMIKKSHDDFKDEIKQSLNSSDEDVISFKNYLSNSNCSLTYRYVGNLSGDSFDITFTPNELMSIVP